MTEQRFAPTRAIRDVTVAVGREFGLNAVIEGSWLKVSKWHSTRHFAKKQTRGIWLLERRCGDVDGESQDGGVEEK